MSSVIVDTSVWVQALRAANSVEKEEVDRLLASEETVMAGVVYTELLRGARDESEFRLLQSKLEVLPFLQADQETWLRAGRLLFDLRRQGLSVSLADALIAALALEGGHQVYTLDDHFRRVPGLRLFEANRT